MSTIRPPRPDATVPLLQPDFTGEMQVVCTLDGTPTPQTLRELVAGDQLVVSPSGSHLARVCAINPHQDLVTHNGFDGQFLFDRPSPEHGVRILAVREQDALVWGTAEGKPAGVWCLTHGTRLYLYPLETLHGFLGGRERMPVGQSSIYPGESVVAMPWGLWPVRSGAKVEVAGETLYMLEPIDGTWYAYMVGGGDIGRFTRVDSDDPLRLVPWGLSAALVCRMGGRSVMREIGTPLCGKPVLLPIDGQVLEAWGSPRTTSNTCAFLVRPRALLDEDVLRLYLNHQLLYEGPFTLRRQDLTWSQGGRSVAARIRLPNGERVVTPRQERALPEGTSLREVLVSDGGHLLATIVTGGSWDRPMLSGGRSGTAVPMAWNLHKGADGSIVWNTVHDGQILRWVDRTHLPTIRTTDTTAR